MKKKMGVADGLVFFPVAGMVAMWYSCPRSDGSRIYLNYNFRIIEASKSNLGDTILFIYLFI
jgi:hypothetical protein